MKADDLVKLQFVHRVLMSVLDNTAALVLNARDWHGSSVIDIVVMSGEEADNPLSIEERFAEIISESR